MQAKDREITLLQQQLGEKVSHELLILTLYPLIMKNFDISMHEYQSRRERENGLLYKAVGPTAAGMARAAPVLRRTIINRRG